MEKLYSKNGNTPEKLPERIVLEDGRTRTDRSSLTDAEIAEAGYVEVESKPTVEAWQTVSWSGAEWIVSDKSIELMKISLNNQLNEFRDSLINSTKSAIITDGSIIPVDMRPNSTDMQNLSSFVQKATIRKLNNQDETMMYKGADNQLYLVSPDDAIEMGESVFELDDTDDYGACDGTANNSVSATATNLGVGSNSPKTVVCVFKTTRTGSTDQGLFDLGDTGIDGQHFCLRNNGSYTSWRAQFWGSADYDFTYDDGGEYTMVTFMHNGSTAYTYTDDNKLIASNAASLTTAGSRPFEMGRYNGGYLSSSKIGMYIVYDKALSSSEITQNFNAIKEKYAIPIPAQPLGLSSSLLNTSGVNASWQQRSVDLSDYAGHQIRLVWLMEMPASGTTYYHDLQLDNITLDGNNYNFESSNDGFQTADAAVGLSYAGASFVSVGTGATGGRWCRLTGNTSSASTGNLGAQSGSYFLYTETSSPTELNDNFWLRSPAITLSGSPGNLTFYEGREISQSDTYLRLYVDVLSQP